MPNSRRWFVAAAASTGFWASLAIAQPVPTISPSATTAPATQPSQVIPEAALQALDAKRYAEAAALLEPLAKSSSASFDLLAKLGGCYDRLATVTADDRTPAGREDFRKYSDKAVEYLLRASQLGLDSGDSTLQARAETLLRRALLFSPRNPSALRTLGRMYEMNGSATMAITQYREYIKTDAGKADYDTQVNLGRLLTAEGYWRQAVDLLEKMSAVAGPDADQQLAMAYAAGRQPDKALDAANRAVTSPRHAPDALVVRASLLLQLGDKSDPRQAVEDALAAVQLVRDLLAADTTGDQTWPKLGGWRQGISSISDTLKGLARSGKLDPAAGLGLASLINGLGELTRMYYDYDAVSLLTSLTRSEPAPADLLVALAQRQRDLGLAAAAVKTAERILQLNSANAIAQKIKDTGGKRETK